MSANSPKARQFEAAAADAWERAATLPEGDAVRQYVEDTARHFERRAREIQAKADRRAQRT